MGCMLHKMSIRGIRSYGTEEAQVVAFFHPLTVIVGNNGSGKTTIIECLKMSCTGELPPNTRSGQSFIHDPKVAGETEVKAQIKLRFMMATKQPVIVIRSFQLTQKKASLQFKALDNTIRTMNKVTGQVEALAYRCADIDKMVPAMMGVSKAVLENVIFVHQEESNWPLAEGQVLKKKFDDIFAATRYTKALEELRKLKTRQGQEAREMKLRLEHLRTHKDHASRLRAEMDENNKKAEALQRDVATLQAQLAALGQEKDSVNMKLMSLADLGDDIKEIKAKHTMLVAQNAETYARLVAAYTADDLVTPLEELEALEAMQPELDTKQITEIARLEREINNRKAETGALKDRYATEVRLQGRLAAEAEAHTRNIGERDRFIRQTATELGLGALPGDDGATALGQAALDSFRQMFKQRLDVAVKALDDRRMLHQREDDERGRAIDRLNAQIGGFDDTSRMKEEQMRANDVREEQLQSQRAGLAATAEAVDLASGRAKACETRLAAKEGELREASNDGVIEQNDALLMEVHRKTTELRSERERLAGAMEQTARMNYKAQELAEAQSRAEALTNRNRGRLMLILGVSTVPSGSELKSEVEKALGEREARARQADESLRSLQSSLATARGTLRANQDQLDRAKAEASALASRLETGMTSNAGAVSETVNKLEEEHTAAQARLQQAEAFKVIVESYCSFASDHNACAICHRPFNSPAEREGFLARQNAERQAMPTKAAALRQRMTDVHQQLAALKELEPAASRYDKLETEEIPAMVAKIASAQQEIDTMQSQLEVVIAEKDTAAAAVTEARNILLEAVLPLEKLLADINAKRVDLEHLRAAISTDSASRTVATVDAELTELEFKRGAAEQAKQQALSRINALRDEVSNLREQLQKAKEVATRMKNAFDRRAEIDKQIADLNEASGKLAAELVDRRKQKEPLEKQRDALTREREEKRADARNIESRLQSDLRSIQAVESQFDTREVALKDYEERNGADALEKANRGLAELLRQQEVADAGAAELQQQLMDAKSEAAGAEALMRQVRDILSYRRSKTEEEQLAVEMDAKGAEMAHVGDRPALQQKYRDIESTERDLRSEKDRALGAVTAVKDAANRAAAELLHPQYAEVEGKYRKQLIELRTTEMASGDLEKYHKALEKALLAFHTTKMGDINAIIKELWQKTYRNTDIDYIQIKADTEGSAARSYNYRVVMSCGGAELDMRGRCSAGQKVLACLIIRLALAETFCLNCGILALDEPTTNLDVENSASLADSLRSIMASRKEQENFQLIVITHDEMFARRIGTRENTEYIWRVEKDERQHSTVRIDEVLD